MPLVTLQTAYAADKKLSKFSCDFYGCSNFTDAKFKDYELYTDMEDKADEAK